MVNGFFEMRQLYEYIQPCAKNNKTERRLLIGLILSIYFWEVRGQNRIDIGPSPQQGYYVMGRIYKGLNGKGGLICFEGCHTKLRLYCIFNRKF